MNFNGGLAVAPGGIIAWIVVGLVAGAIAGRIVQGRGMGCLTDVIVGIVGAFVGGLVLSIFIHGTVGFFGSIFVALVGAILLLAALRLVSRGRL